MTLTVRDGRRPGGAGGRPRCRTAVLLLHGTWIPGGGSSPGLYTSPGSDAWPAGTSASDDPSAVPRRLPSRPQTPLGGPCSLYGATPSRAFVEEGRRLALSWSALVLGPGPPLPAPRHHEPSGEERTSPGARPAGARCPHALAPCGSVSHPSPWGGWKHSFSIQTIGGQEYEQMCAVLQNFPQQNGTHCHLFQLGKAVQYTRWGPLFPVTPPATRHPGLPRKETLTPSLKLLATGWTAIP